jgi:hypothetical protein
MRALRNFLEELILRRLLTKRNVALIDPRCGCVRSPDVRLSEPCPDPNHARSTARAFAALDCAERLGDYSWV